MLQVTRFAWSISNCIVFYFIPSHFKSFKTSIHTKTFRLLWQFHISPHCDIATGNEGLLLGTSGTFYNPGQKSLGQYCNIHILLLFLGSLLKRCILFENFSQFSLPPPYKKLKLEKNSGYTRPTLFVGWGEGLDTCELENAPEMQKFPKTFVHDCTVHTYSVKTVTEKASFLKRSPEWRFLITLASRLRVNGRKRMFSNTMMSQIIYY